MIFFYCFFFYKFYSSIRILSKVIVFFFSLKLSSFSFWLLLIIFEAEFIISFFCSFSFDIFIRIRPYLSKFNVPAHLNFALFFYFYYHFLFPLFYYYLFYYFYFGEYHLILNIFLYSFIIISHYFIIKFFFI